MVPTLITFLLPYLLTLLGNFVLVIEITSLCRQYGDSKCQSFWWPDLWAIYFLGSLRALCSIVMRSRIFCKPGNHRAFIIFNLKKKTSRYFVSESCLKRESRAAPSTDNCRENSIYDQNIIVFQR